MNIGVILAGGSGSRLGMSTPKQFFKVAGKMVIEHTVEVFEQNPSIDEIVIVSNPSYVSVVEDMVIRNSWKKVVKILKGGSERYESTMAAVNAYDDPECNLILHDAVRPLVSHRIIDDVIAALVRYNAVDVAIPATDTIIETEDGFIIAIPDRSRLMQGQTPQAFRRGTLAQAYEKALADPEFKATDDCGVVNRYLPTEPIYVVRGEVSNMKLTYNEDIYLLDKFFQMRRSELPEDEPDERLLKGKTAVVFGGSSGIGKSIAEYLSDKGVRVFPLSRTSGGTDVTDRRCVAESLASIYKETGRIDFVVNSAGVLYKEPLAAMGEAKIRETIDVNYIGAVNVALESLEYLKETKGSMMFFTSSSYTRGRAFYSIYSSTKAAVVNFVQAVAQEWESFGVKVNCINPERTQTPMRSRNFGNEPAETLLAPEKVAEASVRTLVSGYTGQVIDVKI